MKILAIIGSPRPNGNTSFLTDCALQEAVAHGCEVEKIMLCQYKINPCLGHDPCKTYTRCKIEDDVPAILEKFQNADGVILATPVYYYNMSAQMKTFVDRNYWLYTHHIPLKSKVMGLIVVAESEGIEPTIDAFKKCFGDGSGNDIEDWLIVSGYAGRVGDAKKNPELVTQAREMGRQMAKLLKHP